MKVETLETSWLEFDKLLTTASDERESNKIKGFRNPFNNWVETIETCLRGIFKTIMSNWSYKEWFFSKKSYP
jgi:hypothetical protein